MPQEVRSWVLAVCGACVFGALLTMVFPGGSFKKLLHMVISMMILCVIFKPIGSLGRWALNENRFRWNVSDYTNEALEEEMTADAKRIYAAYLEENLRRVLDGSGISYEDVVVSMDNSDDGRIFIGQVEVIVKTEDETSVRQIKQLLMPYIGFEPMVKSGTHERK